MDDISDYVTKVLNHLDPECNAAIVDPVFIENSNKSINKTNNKITVSLIMIENYDMQFPKVRKQLNFILPKSIRQNKNNYTINLVKDINMYRKFYERHAKETNIVIEERKKQIDQIYNPLLGLKNKLAEYIEEFKTTINQLKIPLESERKGLNEIDTSSYTEENKKQLDLDKEKVKKEVNEFLSISNTYFEKYSTINQKNMSEIERSLSKFDDLTKPIKELSISIGKAFDDFENAIEGFSDITNKAKIDETFNFIKKRMEDFCAQKIQTLESIGKGENIKDNIDEKKVEKYEEVKREMDEVCKQLKQKSDDISKNIADIRKKYNEKKIELESINPKAPPNISDETIKVDQSINKVEGEIEKTNEEQRKILEKQKEIMVKQFRFDLLFIMDVTSSMDAYLDEVKKDILEIIDRIKENCSGINLFVGFIGYRDFNDLDLGDQYVDLELTEDYESIRKDIEFVEADGGGDAPEDLCGAFKMAADKKWGGKSRFAILVTDSPCHGTKYHDLEGPQKDNYPDGDREGRDIEQYVKYFAENQVNFYCTKITPLTDRMFQIFGDIYDKNKPEGSKSKFIVRESAKSIKDIVVQKVTEIYLKKEGVDFEEEKK